MMEVPEELDQTTPTPTSGVEEQLINEQIEAAVAAAGALPMDTQIAPPVEAPPQESPEAAPQPTGPDFSWLVGDAEAAPRIPSSGVRAAAKAFKRAFNRDKGTGEVMKEAAEKSREDSADMEGMFPQQDALMPEGGPVPIGQPTYDQLFEASKSSLFGARTDPGRTEFRNFNMDYINTPDQVKGLIDGTSQVMGMHGSGPPRKSHATTVEEAESEADLRADLTMIMGATPDTTWNRKQLYNARTVLTTFAKQTYENVEQVLEVKADGQVGWKGENLPTSEKLRVMKKLHILSATQSQIQMVVKEVARSLNSMAIPVSADPKMQQQFNHDFFTSQVDDKALLGLAKLVLESKGEVNGIALAARAATKVTGWDMVMEQWYGFALSRPSTQMVNIGGNLMVPPYLMLEQGAAAGYSHVRRAWHLAMAKSGLRDAPDAHQDINTFSEVGSMMLGWMRGNIDAFRMIPKMFKASDGGSMIDPSNIKLDQARTPKITGQTMADLWSKERKPRLNQALAGIPAALTDSHASRALMDLWGNMVRMPGRFLSTADDYFKVVAYSTKVHQRAMADAEMAVRQGEVARGSDEYYTMINQTLNDPSRAVHMDATDFQKLATFTRELNDSASKAIYNFTKQMPAVQPLIPFIRVSTNIAKFALDRSPIPLIADGTRKITGGFEEGAGGLPPGAEPTKRTRTYQMLKTEGSQRDLAITRVAGGTAAATAIWGLMSNSDDDGNPMPMLTGAGPSDPGRKRMWQKTGWKPYSMLIGDKYIPYDRLDPFGMWLGMVATSFEIYTDTYNEDRGGIAEAIVFGLADTLSDKTYMRNLGTLMDVIAGDKDPSYMAKGFLSTLMIPNIARTGREMTDEFYRQRRLKPTAKDPQSTFWLGLMNDLKEKTPGWSETLPTDLNWMGEDLHRHKQLGAFDIPPIFYGEPKYDDLGQALLEHGLTFNDQYLERSSWKVPINLSEEGGRAEVTYDVLMDDRTGRLFHEYRKEIGRQAKREVSKLVRSGTYKSITEADTRRSVLQAALAEARKKGREVFVKDNRESVLEFIKENPDLTAPAEGGGVMPHHMYDMNIPPRM